MLWAPLLSHIRLCVYAIVGSGVQLGMMQCATEEEEEVEWQLCQGCLNTATPLPLFHIAELGIVQVQP